MRYILFIATLSLLTSCWPSSVSFIDGSMPEEWQSFYISNLKNTAPNAPLSYPMDLSEKIKDGIQNGTRLTLSPTPKDAEVVIEGSVVNYSVVPIALQEGENAAQNKLTITASFEIFISAPEEDKMTVTSTRFTTFESSQDLSSVEATLLEEINDQIVQDLISKLLSNW
ncbi:MAG: LPS assembly lipoprotein LptE [Crocinitomicaceae bacterium]|nr:LPS assembly lipoprotein LptE [Crocinitomicaceae bacterium]